MCILSFVELEWDAGKAKGNLRKHGIDFADAATALHDERAITILDEESDAEDRFVTVGMDAKGRILVVVYAWRVDRPRVISARRATPQERRRYTEGR